MDYSDVFYWDFTCLVSRKTIKELINIYVAQGTQDAYSLSLKWSNIYQIYGLPFHKSMKRQYMVDFRNINALNVYMALKNMR